MPFIVGKAAREHELYTRLKDFVTGVGFIGQVTKAGTGNGRMIDFRAPNVAFLHEKYSLRCKATAAFGGSFTINSSLRGDLQDADVNKVYADDRVQFYLDFGSANFVVGDTFDLKFAEYSAASKPKLSAVAAKGGTRTETITLTCSRAGVAGLPNTPAQFSVTGSVSGSLGTATQGVEFSSAAIGFTVALGDTTSQAAQFALNDTITVYTTENELRAIGQQWTTLRDPKFPAGNTDLQFGAALPPNDSEWLFKGPGLSGTDEIFCGIRRSWSNSAGYAQWELTGSRGYASSLLYDEQPGTLVQANRPYLEMWSGELPYWISVSGRRIALKIRNNTYYMDLYLGLGIPWGSPKFQPYMLCVGGSSGAAGGIWTTLSTENSNYWASRAGDRARCSMQALNRSGIWQGHLARANNNRGDAFYDAGWVDSADPSIWPYRGNGMQKVRENLDGTTPLLPVTLYPDMGELDGIYAVSGFGNIQPEDLIWHPTTSKKLVVGTNTYRNSTEDFAAMELI